MDEENEEMREFKTPPNEEELINQEYQELVLKRPKLPVF